VDSARVLIIAVRPGSVRGLLKEIGTEKILRPITVVSLAAGFRSRSFAPTLARR